MNKIPEGTQYIESGCGEKGFRKYEKGCWWFFEGYWRRVDWQMGDLIPVSEHPFYVDQPGAWNGEGLPPAETVVELRAVSAQTDWARAKIKFASGNVVVWDWVGQPAVNGLCSAYAHAIEMRPIRSAEQIAADEKRAGIESLVEAFRHTVGPCTHLLPYSTAERLYEIGVRLQVSP